LRHPAKVFTPKGVQGFESLPLRRQLILNYKRIPL